MKKKMKNIINTLTVILLTYFTILIPNLVKNQKDDEINNGINGKKLNSVCKVRDIYYDSLQNAINNNPDNLVYELVNDVNEPIRIVNRSLTIDGNNFKIQCDDLKDNLGIIDVKNSTLNLRNICIKGNTNVKNGLYVTSSNVEIENVIVKDFIDNNEKMPNGVGIYFLNEKIKSVNFKITNAYFENCSAYSVFVDNKGENKDEIIPVIRLKIVSTKFINNLLNPNTFLVLIGNIEGNVNDNIFRNKEILNIDDEKKNYAIYQNTRFNKITYLNNEISCDYRSIYQQINS